MALEPEMPTEHEDVGEPQAVQRKFWIALALTLPVVGIAMLPHVLDLGISNVAARWLRGAELLLSAPVVLWAARDYYRRGWVGVRHGAPSPGDLVLDPFAGSGSTLIAAAISGRR